MHTQKTLSIIKPDAMNAKLSGNIIKFIEDKGFKIIAQKKLKLNKAQAEAFYAIHKDRPFFNDLVEFMTSGPVMIQALEGDDAVAKNRKLMGATNPQEADSGTIRADFAESIDANAVHGSDSIENAKIEIEYFFG